MVGMSIRSDRGSTRTILILILGIAVVGAIIAFFALRPREAPVKPAPPPPAPVVTKVEPPPAPVEKPKPEPTPEPRRRAPKPAPKPEPAAPATGTLNIDSDVPGASVFIDRVYLGTTPVTAKDIKPGAHQLNASVQGYEGISEPIEVEAGEKSLTVRFKEVRLDAAIDVIHKHGVGSCRGRLIATPAGIRYETSNKGDAFSVPLTGLDEFTVDYLKKNLRIKLKGGRTYNFADPEDNADRLFVFHRDVDKARQKLAAK